MYYSIRWECLSTRINTSQIRITFLDEAGKLHEEVKYYEGWLGVCTDHIDRVLEAIRHHFPGIRVLAEPLGDTKKILPYFEERLEKGKLEYRTKPFFKIYASIPVKTVGQFFHKYKFSYYEPDDWLVRIYIDLCIRYQCRSFYYRWYDIHSSSPRLVDSLRMLPDCNDPPDWTLAAFDLESVPMEGQHIPMGHHPADRIVMISLFKWNRKDLQKWILYLLPEGIDRPLSGYEEGFRTEAELLSRFHVLLEGVHVVTGYNINEFDFPCLFSRLLWLRLHSLVQCYQSRNVGTDIVPSFRQVPLTLDLYAYFKRFSNYNLPSFKLDDVARVKLGGDGKMPVKATGLWSWYRSPNVSRDLIEEDSVEVCYERLRPDVRIEDFGTFRTYLDYCLRDSELVYRLFVQEDVLSFLVERANFTALDAAEALHLGNARFLLELFRTYGTRLGYFLNRNFLVPHETAKYRAVLGPSGTYQGALNFCHSESVYEDVAVMDFSSMYPSTLLSSHLCYGTCTILTREEWLRTPAVHGFTAIPYRYHSHLDFQQPVGDVPSRFSYPRFDPERDEFAIVLREDREAFLPQIVRHFIEMRQHHQSEWKRTRLTYHYNVQLCIKILINSLYGVTANKDSPLAYLPIAIIIVTLARYQLLGSYHFLKNRGYEVCYVDTDSLMVHRWPEEHCDAINAYLGLPHVELKFEQRMKRLLILSKKRYVYEQADGDIVTKGFQKKVNGLIEFMSSTLLRSVWSALFEKKKEPSTDSVSRFSLGWIIWTEVLLEAQYRCRDPKKYSIYRKIKKLEEYVSKSCPAVKYLKKYPDRSNEHVEFTYSRADVAASEASNWVMDAEDCQISNYEQLFMSQKKIFITLLNMAYWHLPEPTVLVDQVLNAMHWKRFVHAELLHFFATRRKLALLLEPNVRYTFSINNHPSPSECRRTSRKRKINLGV